MRISEFTRTNKPVVILVNITNPLAINLIKVLLEQETRVVAFDHLTPNVKELVKKVKHENFLFVDINTASNSLERFYRVDYVYDFIYHLVVGSNYPYADPEEFVVNKLTNREFVKQSDLTDMFLKAAVEFNAKYTLITPGYLGQLLKKPSEHNLQLFRYAESLFSEYFTRSKFNGRIVRVAEILGAEMDLSVPTFVTRLLREVVLKDTVTILGEGLQNNYVVDIHDATYGLLKASFSRKVVGKTVHLASPNPVTTLSLAYTVLELTADEKKVEFVDVEESGYDLSHQASLAEASAATPLVRFGWEPKIPLEESLKNTLSYVANKFNTVWHTADIKEPQISEKDQGETAEDLVPGAKYKEMTSWHQKLFWGAVYWLYMLFVRIPVRMLLGVGELPYKVTSKQFILGVVKLVLIIALVFLALPYVQMGIAGLDMWYRYSQFRGAYRNYDADGMTKNLKIIAADIRRLDRAYGDVSYLRHLGLKDYYDNTGLVIKALGHEALSLDKFVSSAAPLIGYIKQLKVIDINNPAGQSQAQYFKYVDAVAKKHFLASDAYQDHAVAQALLTQVKVSIYPKPVRRWLYKIKDATASYDKILRPYKDIYPYIPYLMGYRQRVNYVILMQNNYELRSTGGFLTSYAIVGIENGAVKEFTVDDVYNVDGQFSGLDAPAEMKQYLDYSKIKLSLANWEPELPTVARRVSKILAATEKASHSDIFVTVNFSLLEQLLRITGPVYVAGFGNVSSENLFSLMVKTHQKAKPGTSEKVSVVSKLIPPLITKLQRSKASTKIQLIDVLRDAIRAHDVQIYTVNSYLNELLAAKNAYYHFDNRNFVSLIDYNYGGNKADKFIKRSAEIIYDADKKELTFNVTYTNTSKSKYYPEGDYKDLVRVFYPASFKLDHVEGLEQSAEYRYNSKVSYVIGKMLVRIGGKHVLRLRFKTDDLAGKKFWILKQPGALLDLVVNITDKSGQIKPEAMQAQGFNLSGWTWVRFYKLDRDIAVELQKK